MPARSKVAMLPAGVRAELERRIHERAFSGYQELAEWLQAQGYCIAHDSVQRYGSRLRQKIEAMALRTAEAEAVCGAAPQTVDKLVDASARLLHHKVFSILLDAAEPGDEPERLDEGDTGESSGSPAGRDDSAGPRATELRLPDLSRLTRILADLNRITLSRQRRTDELKSQLDQPAVRKRRAAGEGGLSQEAYQAIRNALLGIDPFDPAQHGPPAEAGNREPTPARQWDEKSQTRLDADERTSTPMSAVAPGNNPALAPIDADCEAESNPLSQASPKACSTSERFCKSRRASHLEEGQINLPGRPPDVAWPRDLVRDRRFPT
jgi:hypothetical protein